MRQPVRRLGVGVFAAVWLVVSAVPAPTPVLAQSADANKPADQAAAQEKTKEAQQVDELAEAAKALSGPAGNPECVWLGRRVVSLLLNDDLDTAFRHLDLYDRFGCPSGHIQASFRCALLHPVLHPGKSDPKADPKAGDTLDRRVQSCWLNPTQPVTSPAATPAAPAPAAAAPSSSTNR